MLGRDGVGEGQRVRLFIDGDAELDRRDLALTRGPLKADLLAGRAYCLDAIDGEAFAAYGDGSKSSRRPARVERESRAEVLNEEAPIVSVKEDPE